MRGVSIATFVDDTALFTVGEDREIDREIERKLKPTSDMILD